MAAESANLSAADIVNDMVTVHLGSKELPSLDRSSSDDKWKTKDFEPIREDGNKATTLQIAFGFQNLQKGYLPRNIVPISEFYKVPPGKVSDDYDYRSIFRTLSEETAKNARMVIVHDSCYLTEALPNLVHLDTLAISEPRPWRWQTQWSPSKPRSSVNHLHSSWLEERISSERNSLRSTE